MRAAAVAITCLVVSVFEPSQAQNLPDGGSGPVEIEASESLEWHSDQKLYVARGDARIRRGDVEIQAAIVTAHYRDLPDGGTQVWRIVADGGVVITTPEQRVQGTTGVYEIDSSCVGAA